MERLGTQAMGTRFELVLVDEIPSDYLRSAGEEALAEIEDAHRRLSAFMRDSVVSHLNRAAQLGPDAGPIPLDGEMWRLLLRCDELVASTAGAFDPGLGLRMEQLGLRGPDARVEPYRGGWSGAVEVDPERPRVRFSHPSLALDLGGVAKGYALDLAADVLIDAGIERAILHGGTSTVLALGPPPGSNAWQVAIGPGARAPVAHLCHAALSVSDASGRAAVAPGALATHVLDPSTGGSACGAERAVVAVPLQSGDALMADALSTATLVRGPDLPTPAGVELWSKSKVGSVAHRHPSSSRPIIRKRPTAAPSSAHLESN